MTYAYAMVLENGTHITRQQPLISLTLRAGDSVITCASPSYLLPTFDDVSGDGRGPPSTALPPYGTGFPSAAIFLPMPVSARIPMAT